MIDSFAAQDFISRYRPPNAIVVATMTTNAEWPQLSTNPDLDLPIGGAMSKASSVALGLALACPNQKVLVLDGDGSLLMNLGCLVTIANAAPANLVHFVFENGVYRTTGGQPTPGTGKFSFAGMAKSAGYANAYEFDDLSQLAESLEGIFAQAGPIFVCLKIPPATQRPPYPMVRTPQVIERFKAGIAKLQAQG